MSSTFDVKKFIFEVKKRPVLYDKFLKDYESEECQLKCITEIGCEMFSNWNQLSRREKERTRCKLREELNRLRASYSTNLGRVTIGQRLTGGRYSPYFDQLHFLGPISKIRNASSNDPIYKAYCEKVKYSADEKPSDPFYLEPSELLSSESCDVLPPEPHQELINISDSSTDSIFESTVSPIQFTFSASTLKTDKASSNIPTIKASCKKEFTVDEKPSDLLLSEPSKLLPSTSCDVSHPNPHKELINISDTSTDSVFESTALPIQCTSSTFTLKIDKVSSNIPAINFDLKEEKHSVDEKPSDLLLSEPSELRPSQSCDVLPPEPSQLLIDIADTSADSISESFALPMETSFSTAYNLKQSKSSKKVLKTLEKQLKTLKRLNIPIQQLEDFKKQFETLKKLNIPIQQLEAFKKQLRSKKKQLKSLKKRKTSINKSDAASGSGSGNTEPSDLYGHRTFLQSYLPVLDALPINMALEARAQITGVFRYVTAPRSYDFPSDAM